MFNMKVIKPQVDDAADQDDEEVKIGDDFTDLDKTSKFYLEKITALREKQKKLLPLFLQS